jgi:ATP-dependent DNA helicase RecQ
MSRLIGWTLESEAAEDVRRVQIAKTRQLFGFLNGRECRRAGVRRYFGEDAVERCGVCDVCSGGVGPGHDVTQWARMATAAVRRTGGRIGRTRLIHHLRGEAKDDLDHELAGLSTYGVGKELRVAGWRAVIDELLFAGYLEEGGEINRPVLGLADAEAVGALWRGERTVHLRDDPQARRGKAERGSRAAGAGPELSGPDAAVFQALRAWRLETARARGVPPYVLFHDRTLILIAQQRPGSLDALAAVSGVGERKAQGYGAEILAVLGAKG